MIVTQSSHTRSPSLISNPMPVPPEQVLHYRSKSSLTSPPKSPPPRGHRPSLSKGMSWLSRSAAHTSAQQSISKPIRISEPQFTNVFEVMHAPRSGTLGSGATIVKTPQEALSAQLLEEEEENEHDPTSTTVEHSKSEVHKKDEHRKLPSTPESPDLPPIPHQKSDKAVSSTQKPALPAPPPTAPSTLRPPMKNGSPGTSEYSSLTSYLSADITSQPVLPPFDPILVSPAPTSATDPFKIIVSLETSTSTQRTTLTTLASRPSHLATYLTSLLSNLDSDAASVQSHKPESELPSTPDSSFNSIFHQHLAWSGLPTPTFSSNMHVFLDRPSAPYEHILAYLRSAPSTPECPATLPRAIHLIHSPSARLQTLLELRDEATYLGLDELHKLCHDEIQRRESACSNTRIGSTSSTSLHSLHTFREQSSANSESQAHHVDRDNDSDRGRDRDTIVTHRSAPKERESIAMCVDDSEVQGRPSLKIVTSHTHKRSRSHGRILDSVQSPRSPPLRSPPPVRATPPPGWI